MHNEQLIRRGSRKLVLFVFGLFKVSNGMHSVFSGYHVHRIPKAYTTRR